MMILIAMTSLAISTSFESGLESSVLLLPSLDDFPILREMFGLPDRKSSPEEMDDDDNDNGLERLSWISPDVESLSSGLRLPSSGPKSPSPAAESASSASVPESSFPIPRASAL
jgi:hypothetical protein